MNSLKTKVTKLQEPIDQLSSAYMKLLREKDKSKQVYEIDPYVEVYQFRPNVYGLFTESLDGMGAPWMYLILGPSKALLIDTSFGLGNLKGLVEQLAGDRALIVVNTHASFDHSYGNFQFDKVHCHEYCVPYLEKQMNPFIWDYLFDEQGKGKWAEFDRTDLVAFKPYQIIGCPNGYCFDLGDRYEIELIFLPGHQAGHCGFLDKQNRILFCGDDVISMRVSIGGPKPGMPYGEFATIQALRNELVKLVKRLNEFDYLFPGHFIIDIESSVLLDLLKTCEAVLANPEDYDYLYTLKDKTSKLKYIRNLGTLAYNERSVR